MSSNSGQAPPLDPRTRASVETYDQHAQEYQRFWRERRPRDAIRRFASMAGRGARVLDLACGPALDVRLLRDQGLDVVAGDLSDQAMALGHVLFPKKPLARWDYRNLPFPDGVFAGVWAPAALQHLPRAEIRTTLGELRRVHASGPIFATFRRGASDLVEVEDPPAGIVYATQVSGDELEALLLEQGYTRVEVEERPDPLERPDVTWLYGWGRLEPNAR